MEVDIDGDSVELIDSITKEQIEVLIKMAGNFEIAAKNEIEKLYSALREECVYKERLRKIIKIIEEYNFTSAKANLEEILNDLQRES